MDLRQSSGFRKYLQSAGWKILPLGKDRYGYLYRTSLGSILRISRVHPLPLNLVFNLAKKQRVSIIKIDLKNPEQNLENFGFKKDSWTTEPSKTLLIDLTASENKIFANFKSKWRQNIRFAEKSAVKVKKDSI